jgi:formate dehydrogenase accessory protein FdhD
VIKKYKALRGSGEEIIEEVPREIGLRLFVNGKPVANVRLSPGLREEFAIGYCIGEGLIKDPEQILEIENHGTSINVLVKDVEAHHIKELTSDCISGWRLSADFEDVHVESDLTVKSTDITHNMQRLSKESENWKKTGGFHSTALVSGKEYFLAEDISRHVLIDKIIGIGVKNGLDLKNSYILTSGRLPGDMVIKVARAGIPLIASRTAPISSGIDCAKATGITLIGFARGTRMNIYTHAHRIKINDSSR